MKGPKKSCITFSNKALNVSRRKEKRPVVKQHLYCLYSILQLALDTMHREHLLEVYLDPVVRNSCNVDELRLSISCKDHA